MIDRDRGCETHEHEPGLPDRGLRNHILAQCIRVVEQELQEHGYDDPERSLEVLHVALEESMDPAVHDDSVGRTH